MKNGLVKKSNQLIESIEAHWKLNLTQSKIIAYLTSKTYKEDNDFKEYIFPITQLNKDLGLPVKSNTHLINATRGILKKGFIELKNKDELLMTHILSSAKFNNKAQTITLKFDPELKPYFLQLKKAFTKYELVNVLRLSSKYAIRIYEYCIMIRGDKKKNPSCVININIKKLRDYLQLEDKTYPLYGRLKERVLSPARKQINENTDIFIDIKENKTRRKVISLIIYVKPNPKKQEHVPLPYKEKNPMADAFDIEEKTEAWYKRAIEISETKMFETENKLNIFLYQLRNADLTEFSDPEEQKAYKKAEYEDMCQKKNLENLTQEFEEFQELGTFEYKTRKKSERRLYISKRK